MPHQKLIPLFDEHCKTFPVLAVAALYQASLLVSKSEELFQNLRQTLGQKSQIAKLTSLLSVKQGELSATLRRLEGVNYGYAQMGYFDQMFGLLSTWIEKISHSKEDTNLYFVHAKETGLEGKILDQLVILDKDLYLSPKGLLSYLMYLCDCASLKKTGGTFSIEQLFSTTNMKRLSSLLTEAQYLLIKDWPAVSGGGEQIADLIISYTVRLYQLPFNLGIFGQNETLRVEILGRIKSEGLTNQLVALTSILKPDKIVFFP